MRLPLTLAGASVTAAIASSAFATPGFTAGNVLVERVGNGTTVLGTAATDVALLEYARSGGAAVQSVAFPNSGANQVTDSGSATSNGYFNVYNGYVAVAGYNAASGTATVASSNTKVGTILGQDANVASRTLFPTGGATGTPPSPFSGNNIRSMIATGANTFYAAGTSSGTPNTGGVWYSDGGSFTQISSTATGGLTNVRNVEIYNNQLYVSSSSGSYLGISAVGNGLSTTGGQSANLVINTGTGSSTYGFVMFDTNADGLLDLAYVADDRTTAGGGISKYTFNGAAWTLSWAYLVDANAGFSATTATGFAGLRGLTGTWDAVNGAQLFATTTETSNNRLISIRDDGGSLFGANLASAGANYAFRGVDLNGSAVPGPGALALLGLAGLVSGRRRR